MSVETQPGGVGSSRSLGTCRPSDSAVLEAELSRGCSRSRRRSRESGGCWDKSIHGNRLLVPLLPRRPSENCHHMGSRWASCGVSIWTSALHGTMKLYCCSQEHKDEKAE